MHVRVPALLVAVGAVAAMSGCGDGTGINAQFSNFEAKETVYAMTGTPTALPAGLHVRLGDPKRVDGSFTFDIAFDLDASNNVIMYPQRLIATEIVATHAVGLQTSDQTFESITRAPGGGYQYDSTLVVGLHKTVLVDVIEPTCSQFFILGPNIKAKLVVDSVNAQMRAIYLRMFVNPNCGFTSLAQGIPKD